MVVIICAVSKWLTNKRIRISMLLIAGGGYNLFILQNGGGFKIAVKLPKAGVLGPVSW
jgi:hypothetical protein